MISMPILGRWLGAGNAQRTICSPLGFRESQQPGLSWHPAVVQNCFLSLSLSRMSQDAIVYRAFNYATPWVAAPAREWALS